MVLGRFDSGHNHTKSNFKTRVMKDIEFKDVLNLLDKYVNEVCKDTGLDREYVAGSCLKSINMHLGTKCIILTPEEMQEKLNSYYNSMEGM